MSLLIWSEQYRPVTLDDYVWRDPAMRAKFEEYLTDGAMPHLLLAGLPGSGKTSLAMLMLKLLGVPAGDILLINATRERKIDEMQDRILAFCQSWTMIDNAHGIKYVLLDEADSMSLLTQKFLRGEMQTYWEHCRFILTCNYPEKIVPALHSRLTQFSFQALDQTDFVVRVGEVLTREAVTFAYEDLEGYVSATYPDLRRCIDMVQKGAVAGILGPVRTEEAEAKDYVLEAAMLFGQGQFRQGRELLAARAAIEDYPDIFRYLYRNLSFWGQTPEQEDDALIVIRDGLYKHAIIADPEINLSATIAQLMRLSR